ncbi:hypothetical protein [Bacillus sp. 1P06AnD]|uniref:hypothetical protein n=1 Tax=Bacillus sp. 1P06AnD TaxID=3132208 RepID=UPI0039A0477A
MGKLIGSDIGNAKTELAYFDEKENIVLVKQPSVVSPLLQKPSGNDLRVEQIMANLYDNLAIHISSAAIKEDGLYFIGKKALSNPENINNMDVLLGGKSKHDIPVIMTLGLVAAQAVEEAYENEKVLPTNLEKSISLGTAIPSSEYEAGPADFLQNRFLNKNDNGESIAHTVILYIATQQVTVQIKVEDCKVTEEGKTAMLAFRNSPKDILDEYNNDYDKKMTPEDFKDAYALHIDIGDGTSELIVTRGFNPVPNGSSGLKVGVGHATEHAISLYNELLGGNASELTRQHFMEQLKSNNKKAVVAKKQLEKAKHIQTNKIVDNVKKAFRLNTSSGADFFFVHGGGSIVFKNLLKDELLKFAEEVMGEVVWIPEKYATDLNAKGTLLLAKALFDNEKIESN